MADREVTVVLRLVAQADKAAQLEPVLLDLAAQSRREKDCISYQVLHNNSDPTDFTLLEVWTSDAALDAHLKSTHVAHAFLTGGPLLAAAPDSRRYCVVGA